MLQLFWEIQSLDGTDDGYISHSELRALLIKLNIHFTEKRFEDAFNLFDTDLDGKITLTEFHAFVFKESFQNIESVYILIYTFNILG